MSKIRMPDFSIEKVGPVKAKLFLESNVSNRPYDQRKIDEYTYEMVHNRWTLNNDNICFDTEGVLLNGQHRLMAVIKSNTTQEFGIMRNMDTEAFKNMDTQKTRTPADVLAIEGVENAKKMAAVAKFIMAFERKMFSDAAIQKRGRRQGFTNSDISDFVAKHGKKIEDAIPYGYRKENRGMVSPGILAGLFYIFQKKDHDQADQFCDKLLTGVELKHDNPIYIVRQKFISDMRSTKKMKPVHKIAILCKGWNFYRSGKKVTQFGWDSQKEAFPYPI